jgi:sodium-coupled neutral amino acid transporter 10
MSIEEALINGKLPPRVTVLSIVWNLANTMMGVGILALAGALGRAGIFLGCGLLFLFPCITYVTVKLLLDYAVEHELGSYEAVAMHLGGPYLKLYAQFGCVLTQVTACVSFLIPVKDMGGFVYAHSTHREQTEEQRQMILLGSVVAINLPLTFLRSLDALQYTSAIAIFFLAFFCVISIETPLSQGGNHVCVENKEPVDAVVQALPLSVNDFAAAAAVVMGSYQGINSSSLFPIWGEMRSGDGPRGIGVKETRRRFLLGLVISLVVTCAFYLVSAIGGYYTFYQITTKVDLLLNCYDPDRPEVLMTYLGMALVCLFSYPLLQFGSRKIVLRVIGYEDQVDRVPYPIYVAVGVTILAVTTLIALFVDDLANVLATGLAWAGPPVVFEIPAMAGMRVAKRRSQHLGCLLLLGVGVALHVLTIVTAQY